MRVPVPGTKESLRRICSPGLALAPAAPSLLNQQAARTMRQLPAERRGPTSECRSKFTLQQQCGSPGNHEEPNQPVQVQNMSARVAYLDPVDLAVEQRRLGRVQKQAC